MVVLQKHVLAVTDNDCHPMLLLTFVIRCPST